MLTSNTSRFLISCFAYRIPAIVVYNKEDLLSSKEKIKLNQEIDYYNKIGFNSLSISAKFDKKMKALKSILKNIIIYGKFWSRKINFN